MPEIRDPVHGAIHLSAAELAVVDCPVYQRLRNIKQLGFAEMTFPGATHNRYLHGIGAMHLAGQAFDSAFADAHWLEGADRTRLRQMVRLGALLHDIGHPPLSHTLEELLPRLEALPGEHPDPSIQATHEDMTMAIMTSSDLTDVINERFGDLGLEAEHVAGLISQERPIPDDVYRVKGKFLRPILSQLVSSELDVDRMDYLLRDSYFTGTTYGNFDREWLIGGLTHYEGEDGMVNLALNGRTLLSFEDFLLSRYHMFVMVYFHHRTNAYDRMLIRFFEGLEDSYTLPGSPQEYVHADDPSIYACLRENMDNPWSQKILNREPLRLVLELEGDDISRLSQPLNEAMAAEGLATEWIASKGVLSKYYGKKDSTYGKIYVVNPRPGVDAVGLEEATELFTRYRSPTLLNRLYVQPEDLEKAKQVVVKVAQGKA